MRSLIRMETFGRLLLLLSLPLLSANASDNGTQQFKKDLQAVLENNLASLHLEAFTTRLEQQLEASPTDADLQTAKAIVTFHQKDFKTAAKLLYALKTQTEVTTRLAAIAYYNTQDYTSAAYFFAKSEQHSNTDMLLYADALLQSGNEEKAAIEFVKLTEKFPNSVGELRKLEQKHAKNPELFYYLAKAVKERNKNDEAYTYLAKALELKKDDARYARLLPELLTTDKQILQHFKAIQKLGEEASPSPAVLFQLGKGYSLLKNKPQAVEAYVKLFSVAPNMLQGDRQAILDCFAVKNHVLAAKLAQRFLQLEPNDQEIVKLQIAALEASEAPDELKREAMANLVRIDPYTDKAVKRLAMLDLATGDSAQAIKNLRAWLRVYPDDKEAMKTLHGVTSSNKKWKEDYIYATENLAEMEPNRKNEYLYELAIHRFDDKNYELARRELRKLEKTQVKNPDYWYRLGLCEIKLKTGSGAPEFEKAYRLAPEDVRYARAYGRSIDKDATLGENVALFQFLEKNKPSYQERYRLGRALYLNGRHAEANRIWDYFLKHKSHLVNQDSMVAACYLHTGDTRKARPILEALRIKHPRRLSVLEPLAGIYKSTDKERYYEAVKTVVSVDVSHGDYQLRLAEMDRERNDIKSSLHHYSQWVNRHTEDRAALLDFLGLSEKSRDTTRMVEALRLLDKLPGMSKEHEFRLAEIDFQKSRNPKTLETLVKENAGWSHGKALIVDHFYSSGQIAQLVPYRVFLEENAPGKDHWLHALADLYSHIKLPAKANAAYFQLLEKSPKDRGLFDKVYAYSKENKSPHFAAILEIGYKNYKGDLALKEEYASGLANPDRALAVYLEVLAGKQDLPLTKTAAKIAFELKDEKAIEHLLKLWTKLDANDPFPLVKLVELYEARRDKQNYLQALESLYRLKSDEYEITLALAKAYELNGKPELALKTYRLALVMRPTDAAIQERLLALLESEKDPLQARDVLLQMVKADTNCAEAHYRLARHYLDKKDRHKAYGHLTEALAKATDNRQYRALLPSAVERDEEIMHHFASLLKLIGEEPKNVSALRLVARGHALQQEWEKSAGFHAKIHQIDKEALKGDRNPIIALHKGGNHKLAGALATEFLVGRKDRDLEIREIEIDSRMKEGKDLGKLRESVQALLAVEPERGRWRLQLAQLDLKQGDSTNAITNALEWVKLRPTDKEGYVFLHPLVANRVKYDNTYTVVLERLMELDKDNFDSYQYELGEHLYKGQKWREAGLVLSKVSERQPEKAKVWHMLGVCRTQLKVGDLGIHDFRKAYELEKTNVLYAKTYAQALQDDKQLMENVELFKFVNRNEPSNFEIRQLAKAYYLNKDYKSSVQEWDKVLAKDFGLVWKDHTAARAYHLTEKWQTAEALYEMRLNLETTNLGLLDTLADLYVKTKARSKYVPHIERIVKLKPDYKEYQLSLAREKTVDKEYGVALDHFEAWGKRNPQDLPALKDYHKVADLHKDTTRLMDVLTKVVKVAQAEVEYHYQLAEVIYARTGKIGPVEELVAKHGDYRQGRFILAREYYKRRTFDKLASLHGFMVKESKLHPDLLGPLGEHYALQKDVENANKSFFEYLMAFPDSRNNFDRVLEYAERNASPYLERILRSGYANFKDDILVKFKLAQLLGKTAEALALYLEILEIDKNNPPAVIQGAEAAFALKKADVAEQLCLRWAQLEPDARQPWDRLIEIYTATGDKPKLADAMARRFQFNPRDDELAFATGLLYDELKDIKKAEIFLEVAAQLKPKHSLYWKTLGLFHHRNHQADKALPALAKAEKGYDFDEEVLFALFQIHMAKKDPQGARERLRRLNAQFPAKEPYAYDLARLESGLEDPRRVLKVLEPHMKKLDGEVSLLVLKAFHDLKDKKNSEEWAKQVFTKHPSESLESELMARIFFAAEEYSKAQKILLHLTSGRTEEPIYYLAGRTEFELKRYADALAQFKKSNPTRKDVDRYLGICYRETGDIKSAADRFEVHYKATGDKPMLQQWYEMERKQNNSSGLIRALSEVVKHQPQEPLYRAELADLYDKAGNFDKAAEQFGSLLDMQPQHEYANLMMGLYLGRKKDFGAAAEYLERGLKNYADHKEGWKLLTLAFTEKKSWRKAETVSLQAMKLNAQDKDVAEARMAILVGLKEDEKLPDAYAHMLKIDPRHGPALQGLAMHHFEAGRYEEAAPLLGRLVDAHKMSAEVWELYARSLMESGKIKEARSAYEEALKLGKDKPEIRVALARLALTDNLKKSQKMFEEAIASFPEHGPAYLWLGRLAADQKDWTGASKYLTKANQLTPTAMGFALMGEVMLNKGDVEQAESMVSKSMELDGQHPKAYAVLAEILLQQGEKSGALEIVKEALKQNPKSCDLLIGYAKVNLAMANYSTTKSNSEYAINLCPEEPLPYLFAGVVAHRSYQTKEAKKYFRHFKKLGGDESAIPEGY